jgi:hypothetical protein
MPHCGGPLGLWQLSPISQSLVDRQAASPLIIPVAWHDVQSFESKTQLSPGPQALLCRHW